MRRHRRRAWERREQRYYRRHSAEVDASLRHSHLRHHHNASHREPSEHHRSAQAPSPDQAIDRKLTLVMVGLAAVGGALAGCHPTATPVVDPIETALFAAGFTLLVARAAPFTWLVVGIAAFLLARGQPLGAPALVVLVVAVVGVTEQRTRSWAGPVVAVLGVQVVLRWPGHLFHGFSAAVGAGLVVLCAVSAWQRSRRGERRRAALTVGVVVAGAALCCLVLGVATLTVRSEALRGETEARTALADAGNGSTPAVVAQLTRAARDTNNAASVIGTWGALARVVPVVAQQQRFLAGALRAASSASTVGRHEFSAIDPTLGSTPGKIDLRRLQTLQHPMQVLDRQLHATDTQLAGVSSPWLVGALQDRVNSFRRQLTQATRSADLGVEATRVVPAMLGADGTRHYLIAFMTPSESRGYDGLIGSYGLLSAQGGHISLTTSGNITNLQDALPKGGARLTGVPQYLARYGAFDPQANPQDLMYAPDLPTDAKVFAQSYAQSFGGSIDGVLAIDPYGLAALLHFTGPVQVPGLPFPLTQANAAQVLLTQEYTTFDSGLTNGEVLRRDFLQSALHGAFDALVSRSLPAPKALSAELDPMAMAGRISFWSFHPGEQPFLRQLGIDGAFPQAQGQDLLAVTTQNAGNNKIDAFLHTSIGDHVTYDPGTGAESSVVDVSLTNRSPARGLPPVIIASPGDPTVAPGANETWLTVYSPLTFNHVTIDGATATMSATRELGVWAYSTYVVIPPGASATVRVDLSGTVTAGPSLRTSVRLQPSANPEKVRVDVTPQGPWNVAGSNEALHWNLGSAMRQTNVFHFVSR